MSSEDADGTDIFPFSDHYVFSEKNPEPEFLSVGQSCVPWSEHTGDLLNDVDQMTVFFSPPSPGQTSVSGTGTLTPGLAHSPIFFFYWIFSSSSFYENTHIRSMSQLSVWWSGPISGYLFSRILSPTKATFQSTEQSRPFDCGTSQGYKPVLPSPSPHNRQPDILCGQWQQGHHSIRLRHVHIKSEKDLAGNWIPSESWLPPLIGLWISPCIANVMGHTPHGSPASTAVWAVGAVVFVSA